MADPKNHWIVCEEYATGPFAEGAAAKRLDEIQGGQAQGDRRTCRYPHAIVISAGKPTTVADRNRELRETEDRQAPAGLTLTRRAPEMTDSPAARATAVAHARQVIALLSPGAAVGHANPELADWEGVIEADRKQRWRGTDDVRVRWTAGTDGLGGPLAGSKPSWHDATAVTVKGACPGCGRPARYVSAGNQYGIAEGWRHDADDGASACRAGTAASEDAPDVIEGTIAPEDIVRANMRAARFPVGSAAEARAVRDEAEQWAQDFAAASRAEDAIVLGRPGPGEERENW